jgi:hypothetical protein
VRTLRTSTSRSENISANVDDTKTRTFWLATWLTLETTGVALCASATCLLIMRHAVSTAVVGRKERKRVRTETEKNHAKGYQVFLHPPQRTLVMGVAGGNLSGLCRCAAVPKGRLWQ